jgi:hypothetical protein
MYDVIYIDDQGDETTLATHLHDREDASEIARREAILRQAGRMVLPGSRKQCNCVCVVPVATV